MINIATKAVSVSAPLHEGWRNSNLLVGALCPSSSGLFRQSVTGFEPVGYPAATIVTDAGGAAKEAAADALVPVVNGSVVTVPVMNGLQPMTALRVREASLT